MEVVIYLRNVLINYDCKLRKLQSVAIPALRAKYNTIVAKSSNKIYT